jgi:hypothetical protein
VQHNSLLVSLSKHIFYPTFCVALFASIFPAFLVVEFDTGDVMLGVVDATIESNLANQ